MCRAGPQLPPEQTQPGTDTELSGTVGHSRKMGTS